MASTSELKSRPWAPSRGHWGGRALAVGLVLALAVILVWAASHHTSLSIDGPGVVPAEPAVAQVRALVAPLASSGAEAVTASYVPGVGAVIDARLLRGPNTLPGQSAADGTRDWAENLLRGFRGQIDAVPPEETVALVVDFYEYDNRAWRQLVVQTHAADLDNPSTYSVWLDGRLDDSPATAQTATAAVTPSATSVHLTFTNAATVSGDWLPVSGSWDVADGAYEQTRLDDFDFLTLYHALLTPPYRLQVQMSFVAGRMGGGLVFGAPTTANKNGSQIVSYSEGGSLMQFGSFDQLSGAFDYQGGVAVPSGADGSQHSLDVSVGPQTYDVVLDGVSIARDVPETRPGEPGYVGLLASTSHVRFSDVFLWQGAQ